MSDQIEQLLRGEISFVPVNLSAVPPQPLLFSGSFNPLHKGHVRLMQEAEKIMGKAGVYELSVLNVDKPPLCRDVILERLKGLEMRPVVLTRAAKFIEKIRLFDGASFVMGYDTAMRMLSTDYHADVPAMLEQFKEFGTRFVVGGRIENGEFYTFRKNAVPEKYQDLFIPITERQFREDISSTELRARFKGQE